MVRALRRLTSGEQAGHAASTVAASGKTASEGVGSAAVKLEAISPAPTGQLADTAANDAEAKQPHGTSSVTPGLVCEAIGKAARSEGTAGATREMIVEALMQSGDVACDRGQLTGALEELQLECAIYENEGRFHLM